MKKWQFPLADLYLTPRLYTCIAVLTVLFALVFILKIPILLPEILTFVLFFFLLFDIFLLFRTKGISAVRQLAEKLSNGDDNPIHLHCQNHYEFVINLAIIDEVPIQFQARNLQFNISLPANQSHQYTYHLRPTERGNYVFGALNIYAASPLGLAQRRFRFQQHQEVPVYPSYLQLQRYNLQALARQNNGIKRVRQLGHTSEFEQITPYAVGNDYRTINWKATARRNELMVNQYQEEKAQSVYNIIDKGRTMKMPFDQMTLLDYAINASLVLSNIAIKKGDKAGLITFSDRMGAVLTASNRPNQMRLILETLYQQKTRFLESDYEKLYIALKQKVPQRSTLLLYTNFESLSGLQRQLPYLRRIARQHLLVVIFFQNTYLQMATQQPANTLEEIYNNAIAEKFLLEKQAIIHTLQQAGILSILTTPQQLTINTLNKYLALKAGYIS